MKTRFAEQKYEGRDLETPDKLVGAAVTADEAAITLHQ